MVMGSDEELAEVRRHHLARVNAVLRRPGLYGRDELAERLLLESMAAVDGSLRQWWAACDGLRERAAFTETGVMGAYRDILPADARREATTSVYAEIAHHLGWLELDRGLSEAEFQQLTASIDGWVEQDRALHEVIDTFGAPSVRIGGAGPTTLAYTTADPAQSLVCFHLWHANPEPVVLAVRYRSGDFPASFAFTPEGLRRRPTTDQRSPTVWVFHGDRARFASAVFDSLESGLAWAAEHRVTGILAEYAHGGAYDVAVREGRFTPSKAHHGTADHVAAFSPGLRHVHLSGGRQDQ
jgi:hypothetical protein